MNKAEQIWDEIQQMLKNHVTYKCGKCGLNQAWHMNDPQTKCCYCHDRIDRSKVVAWSVRAYE